MFKMESSYPQSQQATQPSIYSSTATAVNPDQNSQINQNDAQQLQTSYHQQQAPASISLNNVSAAAASQQVPPFQTTQILASAFNQAPIQQQQHQYATQMPPQPQQQQPPHPQQQQQQQALPASQIATGQKGANQAKPLQYQALIDAYEYELTYLYETSCPNIANLVRNELFRLRGNVIDTVELLSNRKSKVRSKVDLPVETYPHMNFVGKLLGPGGKTLQELQEKTKTKMAIQGAGSLRNPAKENELLNSGDPKYSHLRDRLHLQIDTVGQPSEAYSNLSQALIEVKKVMMPDANSNLPNPNVTTGFGGGQSQHQTNSNASNSGGASTTIATATTAATTTSEADEQQTQSNSVSATLSAGAMTSNQNNNNSNTTTSTSGGRGGFNQHQHYNQRNNNNSQLNNYNQHYNNQHNFNQSSSGNQQFNNFNKNKEGGRGGGRGGNRQQNRNNNHGNNQHRGGGRGGFNQNYMQNRKPDMQFGVYQNFENQFSGGKLPNPSRMAQNLASSSTKPY